MFQTKLIIRRETTTIRIMEICSNKISLHLSSDRNLIQKGNGGRGREEEERRTLPNNVISPYFSLETEVNHGRNGTKKKKEKKEKKERTKREEAARKHIAG